MSQLFQQNQGSVLGIIDLFSGGNFRRLTIFALGIMPYITASIILELMTVAWPYLEKLQKEGELGRRKITQYTRYLTIALSILQSLSIAFTLQRQTGPDGQSLVYNPGMAFTLMTILTLTTGSAFVMWLGEQISERGIGNGMSLIRSLRASWLACHEPSSISGQKPRRNSGGHTPDWHSFYWWG